MKLCKKCNNIKEDSLFYIRKSNSKPYGACKPCLSKASKVKYLENRDEVIDRVKTYRESNLESIKKTKKIYYENNKDEILDKCKSYRDDNKEKLSKYFYDLWRTSLDRRVNHKALGNRRRVIKQRDYYKILSEEQLLEIRSKYKLCSQMTKFFGIPYEVDHIVPLLHPLVCGLHVPANLQIITGKENRQKSNSFEIVI